MAEITQKTMARMEKTLNKILSQLDFLQGLGEVRVDSIKWTGREFAIKIRGTAAGKIGYLDWMENCKRFGLKEEWYGEKFMWEGVIYQATGINPANRSRPIVAMDKEGNRHKFTTDFIKAIFT